MLSASSADLARVKRFFFSLLFSKMLMFMYCRHERAAEPHRLFDNLDMNFTHCISIHDAESLAPD